MLKYASAKIMTTALVPQDASARDLRRFAHRHHFNYQVRPGYLYVRSRAISSRCNDNFDEFPAEELEKGYRTFIGKPVFVNHSNEDISRSRGVIIDAVLHKDSNRDGTKDWWVEVLQEVDALRFPRLAAEILNRNIARTSMGTDVSHSICSACGNRATTPAEYCAHIPGSKGMMLYKRTASGQKVGEIIRETCYGLKFFENSLLVEPPADPTAFFTGVDDRGLKMAAAASGETATHALPGLAPPSRAQPYRAAPSETQRTASLDVINTTAARAYSWDEIGAMHPHIYGDPEIHGERAKDADGEMIGWAANDLAHSTPEDPDAENHGIHELKFRHMMISPTGIDHKRHENNDHRVDSAAQGYREHPDQMPPVVLVHRHGVYQVADGHHRAEGAKKAGVDKIPAYVAKSPYPDTPSEFGSAPYHGARKSDPPSFGRTQKVPEGQQQLFEAKLADLLEEGMPKEAAPATPPEDHPWFKATGLSHHHIVDHWDQSTPEEKAQGKRWYGDAHLVAKSIAKLDPRIKSDAEAAHKGAGVLSAYSPQQGWWANQHNAARAFHEQRAVGKGEGIMVMGSHANAAQKILDGEDSQKVLKGPKTADFAHLIEHGGNKPQSPEDVAAGKSPEHSDKVVVDRHALSVAAGRRLNADDVKNFPSQSRKHYEVVADHYRKAAAVVSDREGREVPPHEVQAVTWLTRQRLNAQGDASPGQKGRNTVQRNQRKQWQDLSHEHTPELHESDPPNSHVAAQDTDDDDYEVNGDNGAAHWRGRDPGSADCATCGYPVTYNIPQRNPLNAGWGHADAMKRDHPATPSDGRDSGQEWERTTRARENARRGVDRHMQTAYDKLTFDEMTKGLHHSRKLAYGETKAPEDVDTLREDACPVCGDRDTFDGATCQVCGYVAPPRMFRDPDLEKAKQMDLRKDIAEFQDPANPNQIGPDGQPIQDPADPGALGPDGQPLNPDAADPDAQPGGLPGEVQAEVQPGGDPMGGGSPMDPAALGPDGQPQDPDELGAPVDPAMLGPDGQPLQQPGQQQMIGPDGMPIGPQALPPGATTNDGKPFTPGPNMPQGPGEPEGPEGPAGPEDLDGDGQIPNPDAGQQAPGTPGDGVPDLQCPACGFSADATAPVSVDMDTATLPPTGEATPDGVQAGDVCPNCGAGQLMSPAEMQGETPLPVPV